MFCILTFSLWKIVMGDWHLDENLRCKWQWLQLCKLVMPIFVEKKMTDDASSTFSVSDTKIDEANPVNLLNQTLTFGF